MEIIKLGKLILLPILLLSDNIKAEGNKQHYLAIDNSKESQLVAPEASDFRKLAEVWSKEHNEHFKWELE